MSRVQYILLMSSTDIFEHVRNIDSLHYWLELFEIIIRIFSLKAFIASIMVIQIIQ